MIGAIIFSLWLPVLVLVISFFRFGIGGFEGGPGVTGILWLVGLTWPAAIPLTLAVRLMHRRSRVLAYLCAAVLGLGTALAVIIGGLFGPVGVVIYSLIAALPAWIILGILTMSHRGAKGQARA